MSVTDLYESDRPSDSASGYVPPQDLAAEQSVLGAMLLSKNAIDPATDLLEPRDFYRPAHETIFECITDLSGRGVCMEALFS